MQKASKQHQLRDSVAGQQGEVHGCVVLLTVNAPMP